MHCVTMKWRMVGGREGVREGGREGSGMARTGTLEVELGRKLTSTRLPEVSVHV